MPTTTAARRLGVVALIAGVALAALALLALISPPSASATQPMFTWTGSGVTVNHLTKQPYYAGTYGVDNPACQHESDSQQQCTPQTLASSVTIPVGTKAGATFPLAIPSGCVGQWDVASQPLVPHLGPGEYTAGYLFGDRFLTGQPCTVETTPPPSSTPPTTQPPTTAPPSSTPPASTPPASTPPASTPPASTPPVSSAPPTTHTTTTHPAPVVPRPSSSSRHTTPARRAAPHQRTVLVSDTVPPAAQPSLAYTGPSNIGPLLAVGLALLVGGTAFLALERRHRHHRV